MPQNAIPIRHNNSSQPHLVPGYPQVNNQIMYQYPNEGHAHSDYQQFGNNNRRSSNAR